MSSVIRLPTRYLASLVYIIQFERDPEIRLKQAQVEKAFGHMFPGKQSVSTNVKDEASPSQPRFLYTSGATRLALSQNSLQLNMGFERSGPNFGESLSIVKKKVEDLERSTEGFLERRAYRDTGIILTVDYPTDLPAPEISAHLFRQFFKTQVLGRAVNAAFTIGFHSEDDLYENLSASIYELREGPAVRGAPGQVVRMQLDVSAMKESEHGLEYKVDVNDKPRFNDGGGQNRDAALLWKRTVELADTRANEFLGLSDI